MTSPVAISGLGTGLASQIDSQSLIQKLVALQQQPITDLQTQETGYKAQVSALGSISSALGALQTATQTLATNGVLGVAATNASTDYTATPGTDAVAGSFQVEVDGLASAAKWHSSPFSSSDTLQQGTYTITVDGKPYAVAVGQGDTLDDLMSGIQSSGAPVSAAVLNDGTNDYLAITATQTGFAGSNSSAALGITFTPTQAGEAGLDPTQAQQGIAPVMQQAQNASFQIDGLTFTRRSNTVTDALPGTTLSLEAATKTPSTLTLSNDTQSTQTQLQSFVNAYNSVMALVQQQLDVTATTDRSQTLAGDSTIRGLAQDLQGLISTQVAGLGNGMSLASLGISTQEDGSLSIDASVLASAIASHPASVNAVFSSAQTGIGALVGTLVDNYTTPTTGLLSMRQSGINQQISGMDDQIADMQQQLTDYQTTLTNQFAAMQSIVSGMQSISDFLTQQSDAIAAQAKG